VALSGDPGINPAIPGLPVVSWFIGLLALQGRFLLRDESLSGGPRHEAPRDEFDPPADTFAALSMTAAGADAPRRVRRFSLVGFALLVGGSLLCVGGGLLSVSGLVPPFVAVAPALIAIFAGYFMTPFNLKKAVEIGDAYLGALGLQTTEMPGMGGWLDASGDFHPRLQGATGFGGVRHGRRVSARIGLLGTEVSVACATPPFQAVTDAGRFIPGDGTPEALATLLARTGSPARWRSAEVVADGSAITIRRRRTGSDMPDWWLDDLWLAERLADAA
jgi:hypothetical protein